MRRRDRRGREIAVLGEELVSERLVCGQSPRVVEDEEPPDEIESGPRRIRGVQLPVESGRLRRPAQSERSSRSRAPREVCVREWHERGIADADGGVAVRDMNPRAP